MYEYKCSKDSLKMMFQCDCKVKDFTCSGICLLQALAHIVKFTKYFSVISIGTATKKKTAKHNAAHLVLEQLKLINVNKDKAKPANVPIKAEAFELDVLDIECDEVDGNNDDSTDDDTQTATEKEFVVMQNIAPRKLESIVKRYVEIYAEDLKCTPAEYLAAVNHWRHPCEMTSLLNFWIMSTLYCKVCELLGANVKHLGTSVVMVSNSQITEANPHVLATNYEYCVWTPISLSDTNGENEDYFMITSKDACGNYTIRKYHPQINEAIMCHHTTKFTLRGSKGRNFNHFYLVTEWKCNDFNELESIDRIISATGPKWDHEKIRMILLRGLHTIHNAEFNYDLVQCVFEWQRLFDTDTELSEVDRIFIDHCLDSQQVKELLVQFGFAINAIERHNARDSACDEKIYQKLHDFLLTPIEQYICTE